jgi:PAS domain-containing protein
MSRPSSDHKQPAPTLSAEPMVEVLFSSDLLETLPDAIVAVDRDGTIVQVNSQAQDLFGYDRQLE